MNTIDDFVTLLRDELGLTLSTADVTAGFDEVPGWDSVNLLRLLAVLERETGRAIPLPDALEAPNLAHVYSLAVSG